MSNQSLDFEKKVGPDIRVKLDESTVESVDSIRSWYVLGMLTLSFSLAYVDRQLLNLLVDPIKRSLTISDTEFSLIQGLAFISAYLIACPIFGRLADVSNRRNILVVGICLWSIFTVLCGFSENYWELFIARFGIGAAEACVLPVGWSLIADYFSARRVPRALSIFQLAPQLGGGFSLLAGGTVIAFAAAIVVKATSLQGFVPWQLAFVLVGAPGLIVAAILLLSVKEPVRRQSFKLESGKEQFTIGQAKDFLWLNRSFYGRIYAGVGMYGIIVLGMASWVPAFLIRYYKMSPSVVGFKYGIFVLISGALGGLLGPSLARRFRNRGSTDANLRASAYSMVGTLFFCVSIPFSPTFDGALALISGAIFCSGLPTGILAAATQLSTPGRLRGLVGSLYTFSAMFIGLGFGPTAIAYITDKFFRNGSMVGYSIAIVCGSASAIGAWLLFSALPSYRRLISAQEVEHNKE